MEKIVLSLSGGIDSSVLATYLHREGYEVIPVFFRYGQRNLKPEETCVNLLCRNLGLKLKTIDLDFKQLDSKSVLTNAEMKVPSLEEAWANGEVQPVTYVPFRNMIFASLLLSYAESVGAKIIAYGAQKIRPENYERQFWDTMPEFVEAINKLAQLNKKNKIKLISPFIDLSKSEIIYLGKKLGVKFNQTISSYEIISYKISVSKDDKGREIIEDIYYIADSKNQASQNRINGFRQVGIKDPVGYEPKVDSSWAERVFNGSKISFTTKSIENKIKECF